MNIAYYCLFIACLMPYLLVFLAKTGPNFNNHSPRHYLDTLAHGWRKRAFWAHQNCFEALTFFGFSVHISQIMNIEQIKIDQWALAFIICRVVYAMAYIGNLALLRSVTWLMGFGCCCVLYFLSYQYANCA